MNTFQNAHIFHRHGNVKWLRFITIEGDNFRFLNPRKMSSINSFFSYPSNENNISTPACHPSCQWDRAGLWPTFVWFCRWGKRKWTKRVRVHLIKYFIKSLRWDSWLFKYWNVAKMLRHRFHSTRLPAAGVHRTAHSRHIGRMGPR